MTTTLPAAVDENVESLVRTHLGLAERLALRYAGRGQPYDDLQQVAYLGLVTAARRFDPDRGVRFVTFAQATVVGELKKYFRDHAWSLHVARPVQELYLEVRTASEELTQLTGRSPTTQELARHVGTTEEHVVEAIEAGAALHVDSLDVPLRDAEEGPREVPFDEGGFRLVEERSWLVPALALLPAREREIIRLRFFEGLPQSAIAVAIGVSQMHVSRLLARALAALRDDAAG